MARPRSLRCIPGWLTEEALDIEWAHAMAPQPNFSWWYPSCNKYRPHNWAAVQLAAKLVAENGVAWSAMTGRSRSCERTPLWDKFFTTPGVVYFAASGDSGIGVSIYPALRRNVVSVGGTSFTRNSNGDFVTEILRWRAVATSAPTNPFPATRAALQTSSAHIADIPMSPPISVALEFILQGGCSQSEAQAGPRQPLPAL